MNDILSFCKFLQICFTDVIQLKVHLADQYQMKLSKHHLYPFTELELYWYLLDNLASFFL